MRTIIIHHRSSHHAKNSGYARLLDYIEATQLPSNKKILPYRVAKLMSNYVQQNSGIYDSTSVLKDVELFQELKKYKQQQIVHYLNAERDVHYVVNKKNKFKNTSFFGTFHKPESVLLNSITNTKYLQKLNGIIAVGSNQVEFLKEWLKTDHVTYIPHGVDTTFFQPDYSKRKEHTLVFVGQHLRDFDMLNYCIPILAEKIKNLKVNVVLREDFYSKIKPHKCITFHSNINDEQLKGLYQEASALFLPMTDVTACNSILEAMACGVPIITTHVGGNPEYLKGTNNILAPVNDCDYLIEATVDLLNSESKILEKGNTSREKSLNYEWGMVAEQVKSFYSVITKNRLKIKD